VSDEPYVKVLDAVRRAAAFGLDPVSDAAVDEIADAAMTAAENDRKWCCPEPTCPNSYVGERGGFELFEHMKLHARAQLAAAQPTLEAANRVLQVWWDFLADGGRWGHPTPELVEALDALAGVVGDEETT
jgi:hypothetical protein